MAKFSKSTRTIIITAAVLLILGVVCLVLFMTQPKDEEGNSSLPSQMSSEADTSLRLTDRNGSEVITAEISNENGSYKFERDKRVISTADESGNVTSTDEFFWTSSEMAGLSPNDTTVKAFMNCIAGLNATDTVEENAEDLEKYGLKTPLSTVKVTFEDGTSNTLYFGIRNPAATGFAYCRADDSNTVYQVNYYTVANVFEPITSFVNLVFTESYDINNPQELDYLVIERKDIEGTVEISYMFDLDEETEDTDAIITSFNSHRITSPIVAEVDSTKGQTVCYGLYGLSASECLSVTSDEDLLAATGLDDPFCRVTFKYGGKRHVLLLGNEIVVETETEDGTPTLTTVAGYYGKFEGSDGIYAFATSTTPWYSFQLQEIVSRRPISPYIYTVDSIVITTPEQDYTFQITGDSSANSFTYGEQELNGDKFRQVYQQLISAVGDELYLVEGEYEPYISVTFDYRKEYEEVYGTDYDTLEFFKSNDNDRKNIVSVNGTILFKVRQVYTERLLSNLDALLNGGEIVLNW